MIETNSTGRGTDTIVQMLEFVADLELPSTGDKIGIITSVQVEIIASKAKYKQMMRSTDWANAPLELVVQSNSARCSTDTIVQMLELVPDLELPCTSNKIGVVTGVHLEIISSTKV